MLTRKLLIFGPIFGLRQRRLFIVRERLGRGAAEEKSMLADRALMLHFLAVAHRSLNGSPKARARSAEAIHSAGLHQAFEDAAIEKPGVDLVAEGINIRKIAARCAGFADGLGGVFANVLDSSQAEANVFTDGSEI